MQYGDLLTRWTVRVAFGFYVLGLTLRISNGLSRERFNLARWSWTLGCLAFLIHVVCAFGFMHQWSHDVAYAATAKKTKEVVGLDWGGGIFANYVFTAIWLADIVWWWLRPHQYDLRSRFIEWTIQSFFGFMWLNATVVFGAGPIRWVGMAAASVLVFVRRTSRR